MEFCVFGLINCFCVKAVLMKTTKFLRDSLKQILNFYQNETTNKIFGLITETKAEFLFTFDKKKIYNLFADYPHNLTPQEKANFDKENPYWVEFFKG